MSMPTTYDIFLNLHEMFVEIRENRVDMVLETLLNSFGQFKLNYAMNKLVISLLELMRELQTGMRVFK
ncbi:hypothetical protein AAG906_033649 [Vitis piasezkii]